MISTDRIDSMRAAARDIVRELGFMQKGLAGTDLSPSAVHTIIELGYGTVATASDLSDVLHLEKSSVSRLVRKLTQDGLVEHAPNPADGRSRRLGLTQAGQALLAQLERFGRQQLKTAMAQLAPGDIKQVETGLSLFAMALKNQVTPRTETSADVTLHTGYRPGMIAAVTGLHASYYATNYGFGSVFEQKVAREMSEFMGRIDRPSNATFSAYHGDALLGSVSLDGEDLEDGVAHLRWFIVGPQAQGLGIGHRLLEHFTSFADQTGFERTRLWTFKGLDAARHLYEKHGFSLIQETPGTQWGREVAEQIFERTR